MHNRILLRDVRICVLWFFSVWPGNAIYSAFYPMFLTQIHKWTVDDPIVRYKKRVWRYSARCHCSTNQSETYVDVLSRMRMKIMRTEWKWKRRSLSKLRQRRRKSQSRRSSVSERSWNKVYTHTQTHTYTMLAWCVQLMLVYLNDLFYFYFNNNVYFTWN